jgi:hypothetical protein
VPKPISFFTPGSHTDSRGKVVKVALNQLKEAVAHFNKSGHRLPLVVGHPTTEDDSFGEATRLEIANDGTVKAVEFQSLDPTFQKIVNSGELPKVSVKLRLPGHPKNSHDGIEFQHLGFFGRSDVSLSKLPLASFSEPNPFEAEFMAVDNDFDERLRQLEEREAAFAKRTAEARVAGLVAAGVVPPKYKAGLVEIFQGLECTATFSAPGFDSDYDNQAGFLEAVFSAKAIPVGRQSDPEPGDDDEPEEFDDPLSVGFSAENTDIASMDRHKKVMAFAKKNKVSYNAAVKMMAKKEVS